MLRAMNKLWMQLLIGAAVIGLFVAAVVLLLSWMFSGAI
jgi:hypothetical protein